HRRGVAEGGVGGVAPAPQGGFVDHVVVQQRGGVDEFHHRGEAVQRRFSPAVAGGGGGQQQHRRAQALAARGDDVLRDFAHQGDVGLQAPADDLVDHPHVVRNRRQHGHETHDSLIIPPLFRGSRQAMYAVIKSGGKQYRVASGEKVRVELLTADVGASVSFDEVVLVGAGDGVKVGTPLVSGAKVKATVLAHGRGDKVKVFKLRRRKHYQKTQGHRQSYTEVRVDDIVQG